jgi:hypothetical protein
VLMVLSSSIVLGLGVGPPGLYLLGSQAPRDPTVQLSMTRALPLIYRETSMWRAWVGFNASHSMGLILFGLLLAISRASEQILRFEAEISQLRALMRCQAMSP